MILLKGRRSRASPPSGAARQSTHEKASGYQHFTANAGDPGSGMRRFATDTLPVSDCSVILRREPDRRKNSSSGAGRKVRALVEADPEWRVRAGRRKWRRAWSRAVLAPQHNSAKSNSRTRSGRGWIGDVWGYGLTLPAEPQASLSSAQGEQQCLVQVE
jgi:hypothetical protein